MLSREAIKAGVIQELVRARPELGRVLSEEELRTSRAVALAARPEPGDVWLFGYGSLLWNPAFHFVERRVALLRGWHRRFCLWTHLGRGSPERPGLVLGLEQGGSCQGIAFRIAAGDVEEELEILWRREMVTGAYRPVWLAVNTARARITALTFVIDPSHERYARDLPEERIVEVVATAGGALGPCAEYLLNTVAHLEQLGLDDPHLRRLGAQVCAMRPDEQDTAAPS
jgi:cation transport protein ChaC